MSARLSAYVVLNVVLAVGIGVLGALGPAPEPRVLFLCLLLPLCTWPLLRMRALNDRYAMLVLFLVIYFVFYGLQDLLALLVANGLPSGRGLLSAAEAAILAGGLCVVVGYGLALSVPWQRGARRPADWPRATLVAVGLALWVAGTAASWYWNVHLTVRLAEFKNTHGAGFTALLMIGRLLQPVGMLILAYAHASSRSRMLLALVIALALVQVIFGFISNTKSGAMLGGIMVILVLVLVRGRLPWGWLGAALLFVLFVFPVFQAYRVTVIAERGGTNAEAARDLGRALELTLQALRHKDRRFVEKSESFFERASLKASVDMIVRGTGRDVPYQHGHTLQPILTAFIPRALWRDKPEVVTGQLLNRSFHVSEAEDTYISPSHLGELYWNFGWPGVIVGMSALGLLLGVIGRSCDLSQAQSVTRLLVLAVSMHALCLRFEGTIAVEYVVWMRSLAMILLLHLLLSRQQAQARTPSQAATPRSPALAFPNLMR